ncbi:DUF2891 domain-containing protein [Sphingobacterium sp. SRCM116780]|uniref:DUF2891 domain-containing protein n=1 Tax=Sphingobacterium sp. SRCM116780 TaxID=2907623 RepID=UPI001F3826CA|nr:DUF2891 domain-containing protein [Sphingobacterium sp. SRCM116780]UIR57519.1 DUF2891 domain-containing protein [Sphingobacterium sp. SRCM116780]
MTKIILTIIACSVLVSCKHRGKNKNATHQDSTINNTEQVLLDSTEAKRILTLPLHCLEVEYPNKLGQVIGSEQDLKTPSQLHPIFYGCFDWHSSVHGYWSMVKVLKTFPNLSESTAVRALLNSKINTDNVNKEIAFFLDKNNKGFERTYGWAWLLQLQAELINWKDPDAEKWAKALQPLADLLVKNYEEYLPKLVYPIRSGQHDNSAFGFSLALDYAKVTQDTAFENLIIEHANRLYSHDKSCNIAYEPSGSDFLSPCLEEAYLMSKILNLDDSKKWLKDFMPDLFKKDFKLEPGIVKDRTDGKLVHLDGLNFSRATCLNGIAHKLPELKHLHVLAYHHLQYSLPNISNDDYMGSHWLGTFALYAITHQ